MTTPMKHQIHADLVHLARPIGEVRINPANTNTHPEEQLEVLASMFQEFGQRGPLIVRKSTGILEAGEGRAPTLTRSDYQWQHEPILYGWREGAAHYWCGSRTERTVWDHRKPGRSKEHPTMKPVELVAQAIANSSRPGDVVFDGFGGGGSTMRAAHQLGRRARLVELSPGYGDAICRSMLKLGERPVVIRGEQEFAWVDNRPEEGT